MGETKQVDPGSAFTPEYRATLEKIQQEGTCPAPFCKDSADYHKHPIEEFWTFWKVTRNSFSYQDAKIPFLLVHRDHIEGFTDISVGAWLELRLLVIHLTVKHMIESATFMLRFGTKEYTGASVTHQHAHLIVSYPPSETAKPITGAVGYKEKNERRYSHGESMEEAWAWAYWKVTSNKVAHQDAKIPFLLVHRGYLERFADISVGAWLELQQIVNRLVQKHGIEGATLLIGTIDGGYGITPQHAHLIVSYPRSAGGEPIIVNLGFSKQDG